MIAMLYKILAETPAPDGAANSNQAPEMSFSDLQKGLREHLNGQSSDAHYRHLLFGVVLVVILIGVVLNMRQRKKNGGPPTSPAALYRELARAIRIPVLSQLLLYAVARHAKVPSAALLVSRELFEHSVSTWRAEPTFTPVRNWGAGRLNRLHADLFDAPIPA